MMYHSTRSADSKITSAEAIVKGIAPDGGLYIPENIPQISLDDILRLSTMNYRSRACGVLGLFLTDYTSEEIENCVENAYSKENFETEAIAPLYELTENEYVLELWHGPTCAFKDMALQILPHLLTCAVKKTGEDKTVVILVATSGDTGKAALEGFKDVDGTKIMVFFPEDGVSRVQKLQMSTQAGANVMVSGVFGNFDDAQTGVKKIFGDSDFDSQAKAGGYSLSSANSINWGRLVPQIVYYVSAYCDMVKSGAIKLGDKINVCVPTGNFGNILAAWYAKAMGLPVAKLICASNKNNVLTDFIKTGIYDKNRNFYTTMSPSMDILISSNLERLLCLMSDEKEAEGYMKSLAETGKYEVSDAIKNKIKEDFYGACCDDDQTQATIRDIWQKYEYLADTHTAVACGVYNQYVNETGDTTKTVIASTANPFKFSGSVLSAIYDGDLSAMDEFEIIDMLSEMTGQKVPQSLAELKEKEIRFSGKCEKSYMPQAVKSFLGI